MDIGTKCACILTLATFISTRGDETNDCYLPPFVCTMIPKDELMWAYPEWQIVGSYRDMLFAYDLAVEIANKIQESGYTDSTGLIKPNVTTWKDWAEFNRLNTLRTSGFEDTQDLEDQTSIKSPPVWLIIARQSDYNYFLKSVTNLPDSLVLLVCKSSIRFPGEFKSSGNGLLEKRLKPDSPPLGGNSYRNDENWVFQTSEGTFEKDLLLQKGGSLQDGETSRRSLTKDFDNSNQKDSSREDFSKHVRDKNSPFVEPIIPVESEIAPLAEYNFDENVRDLKSWTSHRFKYSLLPMLGAAARFDSVVEQFVAKLQVDKAKQKEIFDATIEGHGSERWHEERKFRLTASGFGAVYNWTGTTEKLLHFLLYSNSQNTTWKRKALDWGRERERRAADDYAQRYNVKVDRSGLIVDLERGFLAASPDGLIGNDTLLEIKCPFFLRNANLTAVIKKDDLYCCTLDEEKNQVRLNRDHFYYYQVQGELGISGRKKGVFVLWTPRGFLSETIDFDPELWKKMTVKLEEFYKMYMVPEFVYNYHRLEQARDKR